MFGFFYCFLGTYRGTKNEKMAKFKKDGNNKKLLFLNTLFSYTPIPTGLGWLRV